MLRTMLNAKIHRATITGADLHYEGSLGIDEELLEAAGIVPGEQVHVYNINNGARLVTYAITAPRGSGTMLLNGAAARLGMAGDKIIVVTYVAVDDAACAAHHPSIVHVDDRNRIVKPALQR